MVALINGLSSGAVGRGSRSHFHLPGPPGAKGSGTSTFLGWQGAQRGQWCLVINSIRTLRIRTCKTLLTSGSHNEIQGFQWHKSCHSRSSVLWVALDAHHKSTGLLNSWFSSLEAIRDKCHCPAQIKIPQWKLAAWNTVQDGWCVNVGDGCRHCQPLHSPPLP